MDFGNNFYRHLTLWSGIAVLILSTGYAIDSASRDTPERLVVDDACELQSGPCLATALNGKSVELSIAPDGIPLLQPLELVVKLHGIEASAVEVVFSGVDVDMGRLTYPLTTQDGRRFDGGASLSVCTQRRMIWKALVVITAQGKSYSVPFLFDTEYRPRFKLI